MSQATDLLNEFLDTATVFTDGQLRAHLVERGVNAGEAALVVEAFNRKALGEPSMADVERVATRLGLPRVPGEATRDDRYRAMDAAETALGQAAAAVAAMKDALLDGGDDFLRAYTSCVEARRTANALMLYVEVSSL